ncbi:MAG: superoxide dismutase family protein [Pseudomonadota bacterium]
MIRKALFLATLPLVACAVAPAQDTMEMPAAVDAPDPSLVESMPRLGGDIIDGDGEIIGAVSIIDGPHGLMIEATIQPGGLLPGWHGLHLHQVGDCSDVGVFRRSGGHLGMISGGHGLLNPVGPEIGDVPNIWAAADGSAGYETFTNLASASDLQDADGTAMVIHANRDDHISQPIGGSGPRIACAVIR